MASFSPAMLITTAAYLAVFHFVRLVLPLYILHINFIEPAIWITLILILFE